LRRALTPDDHVAIAVDEQLPDLPRFLTPLLEHLASARITPDAITLLCASSGSEHGWVQQLPPGFAQVKVENHDPHNRKRLSYLATTKLGRRIYLNRTLVDADQLVVLSRRYYDPLLGVGGAEGAIYPTLGDFEMQQSVGSKLSMAPPGSKPWPLQQEAAEVAWLLGAPFFVQVIQGGSDDVVHVLGGPVDSSAAGRRLLDATWHVEVDQVADLVIAQIGGDPSRHTFAALASALACASRVVTQQGRIIVISGGSPEIGPGGQLLRQADTPDDALTLLMEQQPADLQWAFQWASAAQRANLCLLSSLAPEIVEELFMTPLENMGQVERLIGTCRCLYLPDADKTLATEK
jgi:nickel-dependent lactate racemase